MPVYEYLCSSCGPFTAMRPMVEHALPNECPDCGFQAPRVLLTAPKLASMSSQRRAAFATNERSADAPTSLSEMKSKHGAACTCCSGKSMRYVKRDKNGAKSFPSSRPWMISH
ncbi:MAG: zinc ribbon domain-containing protein [Rhizobiales bacterium]|nr:zinc ribbon domain-containing protein [Hyphomicrobiales bacterium]